MLGREAVKKRIFVSAIATVVSELAIYRPGLFKQGKAKLLICAAKDSNWQARRSIRDAAYLHRILLGRVHNRNGVSESPYTSEKRVVISRCRSARDRRDRRGEVGQILELTKGRGTSVYKESVLRFV